MDYEKHIAISKVYLSYLSIIAIIVGAGFTLFEYNGYKADKKINYSLNIVADYTNPEIMKHRTKLDEAWEIGYPILIKNIKNYKDTSNAYNKFILALVKEENLSRPIDYVMDFYERISLCVSAGLCKKDVIDKFFLRNGQIFFRKYYPYVCDLRKKWNDDTIWLNVELYFNSKSAGEICN